MQTILVTGSAGFIGFHLTLKLIKEGHNVVGIDNLNDYYDVSLKIARLALLYDFCEQEQVSERYHFIKMDITDRQVMKQLFRDNQFDRVFHLAAQAGVRYSIESPETYIDSNIVGFANILEGCRNQKNTHLLYASSSSVYGMNTKTPFSTADRVDYPVSLYAATKKSNELMAHTYSHLFSIPTTGLRFFTVYGPWGRPDMAYFSFTKKITQGQSIDIYNNGKMKRDFTYIDDIVEALCKIKDKLPEKQAVVGTDVRAPYKIYNIGNNQPISLERFIQAIEASVGKQAVRKNLPMQPGDVPATYADVDDLMRDINFKPNTEIEEGISNFVDWFVNHYSQKG